MTVERKWSCGCHEVDGVLVETCTQTKPHGEVSAAQHASAAPYSAKCFRAEPKTIPQPEPAAAPLDEFA